MASAEGLAQRAARGIGRTRGGAVVAPRDVFWWRFQHRPAQDFRLRRRSYLHAVRKDFTSAPPATSWRPRCRDVPNAREGSRVCSVAFVRSSHTVCSLCVTRFQHDLYRRTLSARLRHDVLHALLRTSARRPPTCSPLPHQRRLAIMLEACLRHDSRVREDATRVGEEGETGTRRWEENVSFGSKADLE